MWFSTLKSKSCKWVDHHILANYFMLVFNKFCNHISIGPTKISFNWILWLSPCCRWCILNVITRLATPFSIPLRLPNLSTRDVFLYTWSLASSNCLWVPRLWHLALQPTILSQGCWFKCMCSYSCVCHPYSSIFFNFFFHVISFVGLVGSVFHDLLLL